jgi:hypothetical protein
MEQGILIGEFEKNSREIVRVQLTEFKGFELLDVRSFYKQGEDWSPGKGLALCRDLVTPLLEALQAAEKAIHAGERADSGSNLAAE